MTLGIDIHPIYQRHIDWNKVKNTPVQYIWVKVSDGGVPYRKYQSGILYTPDVHVRGALSIGRRVGGYHYAQFSPSPEQQANLLTIEVRRLGAVTLAPALDLEHPFVPGPLARDFAVRFIKQLKFNGFDKVAIYGYTAMFQNIRPDLWDIPGLVIWAARPVSDGDIGDLGIYRGRCDVHQYTSVGQVNGIEAEVDCNQTLNSNLLEGDDDMGVEWNQKYKFGRTGHETEFGNWIGETNDQVGKTLKLISELTSKVSAMEQKLNMISAGNVDYQLLAKAVNDELARRQAE